MRGHVLNAAALPELLADFHAAHRQRFSYANPGSPVEIVSVRASAIGRLPRPEKAAASREAMGETSRTRRVRLDGSWQDVPVIRRETIAIDTTIGGPAIIEEDYTTVVLAAGWTCLLRDDHLIATRVN
jgi:N-methylhydantoinase A